MSKCSISSRGCGGGYHEPGVGHILHPASQVTLSDLYTALCDGPDMGTTTTDNMEQCWLWAVALV